MGSKITTIQLTKPGYCFLGLMLLFYFFSLVSQMGLLYFIIGIVLGCYVINFLGAYRTIRKLEVILPELIKTVERKKIIKPIEFNNKSSFQIGLIEITSGIDTLLKIKNIPSKSNVHISPDLIFDIRGIYNLSDLRVNSIYPFGFFKVSKTLCAKGKVIVYPAIYNCTEPAAAGVEPVIDGKFCGQHKSVYGNDFAGVRPFLPGDPIKYIHWKSSSKGLGFMVKQFNEKLSGRVSFVIDNSAFPVSDKETTLDCAVRATGSMIFSALDIGHHTELIDLFDLNVLRIPPFSDGDIVMETLAGIKSNNDSLTKGLIDKALSAISSKAAVCFVLSKLNGDVMDAVNKLQIENRSVSLYLPSSELLKAKTVSKEIAESNESLLKKMNLEHMYYYGRNEIN